MAKKYMSVFNNGENDLYIKDSEAREGLDDIFSSCFFEDVYIGAGVTASDVAVSSNLLSRIRNGKPVSVTCQSNKIWCLVPSSYSIQVYMSGFDIPVTVETVTVGGKSYKAYSSRNTYTGTFNVSIS